MRSDVLSPGHPAPRLSSRRKAIIVASLVGLAIAAMAVLAEGFVRLRQALRHGTATPIERTFTVDPISGLRIPRPGLAYGNIRISSLGFRGPELVVPKPAGTVRLAFLGASTTYCAEVSGNDMTWPHLVAEALRAATNGVEVDYVNGAVPGYTVASSLKNLQHRVRPLSPDVIVIYHATNDLAADSYASAHAQGLIEDRPDRTSWLGRHSMLWLLVEKNLAIARRQARLDTAATSLQFQPDGLSAGFRERLTALVRAAGDTGATVALVTFAPRLRAHMSLSERREAAVTALYYMPYMSVDGLLRGYAAYNRVIREVAGASGATVIEAEGRIPPDAAHYVDSVHFTDAGSRAMAEIVASGLLEAALVRSRFQNVRQASR
jgi:lysophospholipase L1-like esterase